MQKLGQKIRNTLIEHRLKAKDFASVKRLKLIFRERMHENCKNIGPVCNSLSSRHLLVLNSA